METKKREKKHEMTEDLSRFLRGELMQYLVSIFNQMTDTTNTTEKEDGGERANRAILDGNRMGMEQTIRKMRQTLYDSEIIKPIQEPVIVSTGTGAKVLISEEETQEQNERLFYISGCIVPGLTTLQKEIKIITPETELGKNIIGQKTGDHFFYITPSGKTNRCKIVEIISTKEIENQLFSNLRKEINKQKVTA